MRVASAVVVLLAFLPACSDRIAGGPEPDASPPSDAGSPAPLDATADAYTSTTADASEDGTATASAAARFVGTWKSTQGSSLVKCPGAPHWPDAGMTMDDRGGIVHIREGAAPGTITMVQDDITCTLTYTVADNVATLLEPTTCVPPQSGVVCNFDAGLPPFDGGVTTWLLTADTLTLAPDGATYSESYSEDLHNYFQVCDGPNPVSYDCTATADADILTRQ